MSLSFIFLGWATGYWSLWTEHPQNARLGEQWNIPMSSRVKFNQVNHLNHYKIFYLFQLDSSLHFSRENTGSHVHCISTLKQRWSRSVEGAKEKWYWLLSICSWTNKSFPVLYLAMIKQFLTDVYWQDIDYLIIDTPPGTSDEHITVMENLKYTKFLLFLFFLN